MNAYKKYEISDIFENDNGEKYVILGLSEERDKALLCTMGKTTLYIGAKGLCEHHWCAGHYFMEDISAALDWFAEDDSKPKKKEEERTKMLFVFDYHTHHVPGLWSDDFLTMNILAYDFESARDYLFNMYKDSEWKIIDYNCNTECFLDATVEKEDE